MSEKNSVRIIRRIHDAIQQTIDVSRGEIIRPFDIILFKGNRVVDKLISLAQMISPEGDNQWTSAGIVVDVNTLPVIKLHTMEEEWNELFIWQSCLSSRDIPDIDTAHASLGVQIRSLKRVMGDYGDDSVAMCKTINNPLDAMPLKEIKNKMMKLYKKYGEADYDISPINNIVRMVPMRPQGVQLNCCHTSNDDMWSSELVGHVLREFGVIDIDPSYMKPEDFSIENTKWSIPAMISLFSI